MVPFGTSHDGFEHIDRKDMNTRRPSSVVYKGSQNALLRGTNTHFLILILHYILPRTQGLFLLTNLPNMAPIFNSMAIMALSIFSVLGSPVEQVEGVAEFAPSLETRSDFTLLEKRADFQWRFCESSMLGIFTSQLAMSAQEGLLTVHIRRQRRL